MRIRCKTTMKLLTIVDTELMEIKTRQNVVRILVMKLMFYEDKNSTQVQDERCKEVPC